MTGAPASFNLADIWEWVAGRVPERTALVCGSATRTYAELDGRANRLAHYLSERGIGPGDRVALVLRNSPEYLEAMLAAFKLRAIPVNVNFRYTGSELGDVLGRSKARAVVVHRSIIDALAESQAATGLTVIVVKDMEEGQPSAHIDGAVGYDMALCGRPPTPPVVKDRSGDDHYLMFTGGTTGMPKGVLWRHEDAFYSCLGGGDPMRTGGPITELTELDGRIVDVFSYLPIAPMMHAAAQWTSFMWLFAGAKVVLVPGSFDAEATWLLVEREKVNLLTVVGDAVAKPLLDSLDANPGRWDTSSLFAVANGAAPLSLSVRRRLAAAFPNCVHSDGMGSSESGIQGASRLVPGDSLGSPTGAKGVAAFTVGPTTAVFDESLKRVAPGSTAVGRLATTGRIPIGYDGDPELTNRVFVYLEGQRWVLSGDMCMVDSDGVVRLLGRGSQSINTGGEKVYPEEVEGSLQAHPAVADVLVVGVPDERWGEAVTAVVAFQSGVSASLQELRTYAADTLAGYKLPKSMVVVDRVRRTPAGKPDYRWASEQARLST